MSMREILACLLLVGLVGCSSTSEKKDREVAREQTIRCSFGWAECYQKANRYCANGFDELDRSQPRSIRSEGTGFPGDRDAIEDESFVRDIDERSLTIRCRE